ncbi:hypothetical protein [Pseudoalteromonas denitrificans]|uniref:Uncharacterized protein n=1 Tax=Pseudoalteromonas denitrificans DSM 6059 TaxID=1123010 RepID=A0A1I1N3Y0_9GAMM|nr:hypothetical protein [Pseudoalteromonas denitrificans]SFC92135.1 hypothetical protein SAMN02745724_02921 [Pseudoalteromonas denitrificans DSM 6059]
MNLDYTKYSISELLDVEQNIDKKTYPERYQLLCEEIAYRKSNGEYQQFLKQCATDENESSNDKEFILSFSSGNKMWARKAFIVFFVVVNLGVFLNFISRHTVTSFDDLEVYTTTINQVECLVETVEDTETDIEYFYYDLKVGVFSALNIDGNKCQKLAKTLALGNEVTLWQSEGVIFQLMTDETMHLSYAYLKQQVIKLKTENDFSIFLGLALFWFFLYKSLANAIKPGTFKTKK